MADIFHSVTECCILPNGGVCTAVDVSTASAQSAPVYCREWQLKMKVGTSWLTCTQKVNAQVAAELLFILSNNYLLQPVALKRVGAESTGAAWSEVGPHINHVGSFTLQGDHVKALPHQVVAWYKGSGLALAVVPDPTGENKGVVRQKEEETQVEKGWG